MHVDDRHDFAVNIHDSPNMFGSTGKRGDFYREKDVSGPREMNRQTPATHREYQKQKITINVLQVAALRICGYRFWRLHLPRQFCPASP